MYSKYLCPENASLILTCAEFNCFHDSIYRNLRGIVLVNLYVNEHCFESPWILELIYYDCIQS